MTDIEPRASTEEHAASSLSAKELEALKPDSQLGRAVDQAVANEDQIVAEEARGREITPDRAASMQRVAQAMVEGKVKPPGSPEIRDQVLQEMKTSLQSYEATGDPSELVGVFDKYRVGSNTGQAEIERLTKARRTLQEKIAESDAKLQAEKEANKAERKARLEAYDRRQADEKATIKESRKGKSLSRRFFSWWAGEN
ncbi:hypothetical protein HYX70_04820 [Candidatus Saccharibacteria bacterium]|nr:hypothetical protein [Candidatus Saccharibacteria bacterium]